MDEEQKLNQLRKLLGPALPAFRTAVAARRATGATDEDIEAMLAEIEAEMRSLETMDADQISDMMKIYREELEAATSTLEGPETAYYCPMPVVNANSRSSRSTNRGKHLTGCMMCNIWWTVEGNKVRLSEDALRRDYKRAEEHPVLSRLNRLSAAEVATHP